MITTRPANASDLEWIFEQGRAFSKTYDAKFSLAGNEEHAKKFLEAVVENHLFIISLKDDVRTGFIAGLVQPHHFNPNLKMLTELLWWVPEEHRGGASGAKLFLEFVKYGKANCDVIVFTLEETTPLSDDALIKRGFRLQEKAYIMECR